MRQNEKKMSRNGKKMLKNEKKVLQNTTAFVNIRLEDCGREIVMCQSQVEYQNAIEKNEQNIGISNLYGLSANDLLSITNQIDKYPVDLKLILNHFNISALPLDLDALKSNLSDDYKEIEILGALVSKDSGSAIFYNKNFKEGHRYRFTIAHELAHACLNGPSNHIEFRIKGIPDNKNEITANTFAGELLIPENTLKAVLSKLILPTVKNLSEIFEVSENVVRARLDYLNIESRVFGFNA